VFLSSTKGKIMSDSINSRPDNPILAGIVKRGISNHDSDFSKWCEKMRTTWPQVNTEFLSKADRERAAELVSPDHYTRNRCRGHLSWLPDALVKIFSAELSPPRMLAILRYFLSFVVHIIMVDYDSESIEALHICVLLRRAIEPMTAGQYSDPPFLDKLWPSDDAEPMEEELLEEIAWIIEGNLQSTT
jgi:hypothetical protein